MLRRQYAYILEILFLLRIHSHSVTAFYGRNKFLFFYPFRISTESITSLPMENKRKGKFPRYRVKTTKC